MEQTPRADDDGVHKLQNPWKKYNGFYTASGELPTDRYQRQISSVSVTSRGFISNLLTLPLGSLHSLHHMGSQSSWCGQMKLDECNRSND